MENLSTGGFSHPHGKDGEPGSPEMIAARVKAVRELAGLSQLQVAQSLNWKAAETVSAVERGDRQVRASELAKMARLFRVPVDALLGVVPIASPTLVLWRTTDNTPHADDTARRQREAALLDRAKRYALLSEWTNEPPTRLLPQFPINPVNVTDLEVRVIADQCRSQMDLGPVPGLRLVETLECSYGVKIFFEPLQDDGDGSAACTVSEVGPAMLISSGEPPWRRAFSVAHELFHLVTWDAVRAIWDGERAWWYENLERRANTFASALLMPEAEVLAAYAARSRGGPLAPPDAAQLALDFRVSLDALAIRLAVVGLIDAATKEAMRAGEYRDAWRTLTRRKWDRPPRPFTQRYCELVLMAYERGEIGRSKAAELLEVPAGDLRQFGFDESYAAEAAPAVR